MRSVTGNLVLAALDDFRAEEFATFIEDGLNFEFTFTGSIPLRQIDIVSEWERERKLGSMQWGIYAGGRGFIGTTGLYSHRDVYRSWEFRILIGHPEALGQGFGTIATKLVVDWGFKRLNAHRIWLGCNAENERAVRCYKSVGFKEEGRLRDEIYCGGKYVDAVRMSILESEWPKSIAQ
jgi:RimJ/RimL family protein N-acetyltransferase